MEIFTLASISPSVFCHLTPPLSLLLQSQATLFLHHTYCQSCFHLYPQIHFSCNVSSSQTFIMLYALVQLPTSSSCNPTPFYVPLYIGLTFSTTAWWIASHPNLWILFSHSSIPTGHGAWLFLLWSSLSILVFISFSLLHLIVDHLPHFPWSPCSTPYSVCPHTN